MRATQDTLAARALDARTVLIDVCGDIDRAGALEVHRAVGAAARRGLIRAVVDLSDAHSVQPGVLAVLLHARRRLLALGGELTVVGDDDLLAAGRLLPTARTVDDALVIGPFRRSTRAVPEVVGPLRRALVGWAAQAGASEHTQDSIALAASETITNAIVHAYRDREVGSVRVTGDLVGLNRIRVVVGDDGDGMTPRTDSPGLGLGLPLVTQVAQEVRVDSGAGRGTRVAMEFSLLSGR